MRAASLCLVFLALGCGKSAETPAQTGGAAGTTDSDAGAPHSDAGAPPEEADGGAGSTLVDCDPAKVLCKRAAPECAFGLAPVVVDGCYGECVRIERCACSSAAQCPDANQYTCWSKQHCGPFVN